MHQNTYVDITKASLTSATGEAYTLQYVDTNYDALVCGGLPYGEYTLVLPGRGQLVRVDSDGAEVGGTTAEEKGTYANSKTTCTITINAENVSFKWVPVEENRTITINPLWGNATIDGQEVPYADQIKLPDVVKKTVNDDGNVEFTVEVKSGLTLSCSGSGSIWQTNDDSDSVNYAIFEKAGDQTGATVGYEIWDVTVHLNPDFPASETIWLTVSKS